MHLYVSGLVDWGIKQEKFKIIEVRERQDDVGRY